MGWICNLSAIIIGISMTSFGEDYNDGSSSSDNEDQDDSIGIIMDEASGLGNGPQPQKRILVDDKKKNAILKHHNTALIPSQAFLP